MGRLNIEGTEHGRATNEFLEGWLAFENTLRNELVKIRANDLGLPGEKYLRHGLGFDPYVIPLVHQATRASSPLEIEIALLRVRWDYISQYEGVHHFDLTAIILNNLGHQ